MSGSKRPEAGRSTGTGSMNKISEEGLSELFQGCRTYRRYEQKDINQSLIHEIIEDARTASCGSNRQRLRYLAVLSTQLCAKLADHVHYAALLPKEAGEPKEHEKAKAFLVILSPKKRRQDRGHRYRHRCRQDRIKRIRTRHRLLHDAEL